SPVRVAICESRLPMAVSLMKFGGRKWKDIVRDSHRATHGSVV
ncbi:MAG: hypothetical protein ACI83N_002421, partial [Hydrogenophaga sp.]